MSRDDAAGRAMTRRPGARREFVAAVLTCAAGAALVLYLTTLTWEVEVVARPAPLPEDRRERTGATVAPYLPALGWLALAGAGALLATRGRWRQGLGVVLVAVGAGMAAGGVAAALRPATSVAAPALCAAGALMVAAAGGWTLRRGPRWPAMGARYERPAGPRGRGGLGPGGPGPGGGDSGTGAGAGGAGPAPSSPEEIWNALDRGEDPTA